jgi:drug/metabolite transporter (DMT)-like permease
MTVSPLLILGFAVLAVAHGAIFVRLAGEAPAVAIAAWRLTFATGIVLPLVLWRFRSGFRAVDARTLGLLLAAGVLLAAHFATWIASLDYTSISNSVVLVSTAPLWVAILGRVTGSLRLSRRMIWAVLLSVAGAIVIGGGSMRVGVTTLKGDLLALAGAVCMGSYLLVAQRIQRTLEFGPYVLLVYAIAASFLWAAALLSGEPLRGFSAATWWSLLGIAVVSQVIGHSGYNWSLRHLRPDFVAVTLLGEPIVASLLGLALFGERIPAATLAGGAIILGAIAMAARAQFETPARAGESGATRGSRGAE